eukprot:SAG31_NODE_17855_length_655_cov_1.483813_1_plen_163_part_10
MLPVSARHSDRVAASELDGLPALLLYPTVRRRLQTLSSGVRVRRVVALPLFFGPSDTVTSYIPEQLKLLQQKFRAVAFAISPPLACMCPYLCKRAINCWSAFAKHGSSPGAALTSGVAELGQILADRVHGALDAAGSQPDGPGETVVPHPWTFICLLCTNMQV